MSILDKIEHQSIKSAFVVEWVDYLNSEGMSIKKFHNAKAYYKRKGDVVKILELAIAFEIHKLGENSAS
ncbi:hypothetical protein NVP1161O_096 [Vibrio phage 1.161.O._10N.261.48.C5]|nr:hypothetical protein NVP1161O_096 [Vibrio phage 1.161.O._10N.261.48.C5]